MRRRGFLASMILTFGLPAGWLGQRLGVFRRDGGWVLRQDD